MATGSTIGTTRPATLLLAWFVGLKALLLWRESTAGLWQDLAYVLPDVAAALLCIAVGSVFCRPRMPALRYLAAVWWALCALLAAMAFAHLLKTGSVLDATRLWLGLSSFGEYRGAIMAEVGWSDGLLVVVPVLLLLSPLWAAQTSIRSGRWSVVWLLSFVTAALAALACRPAQPRQPALARALLEPFIRGPLMGGGEVAPAMLVLPDPAELRAPWQQRPAGGPTPNVIFIFLESVRATATTVYQPSLDTTPFLADLARRAVVFERAQVVVPHTTESVLAMLTGYPPELAPGTVEAGRLPAPGLPSLLRDAGYRSAFIEPATEFFESRRLLLDDLGFDDYVSMEQIAGEYEQVSYLGLEDRALIEPALEWLGRPSARPFFLCLMNLCTHHDYRLPEDWQKRDFAAVPPPAAEEFQNYLNTVAVLDEVLAELFARLEAAGHLENTVVILAGDHGEAFGEHGLQQHDDVLWQEGARVLLLMVGPPELVGPPRRDAGLRQLLDLVPTVADLLAVPAPPRCPGLGSSLLAAPATDRRVFMFSHVPGGGAAIVQGWNKYMFEPRYDVFRAFDLQADPLERHDLAADVSPAHRARAIADMRAFQRGVNQWYHDADSRETERIRRRRAPPIEVALDRPIGDFVRLLGFNGRTEQRLGRYLDIELVFEVRRDLPAAAAVELSTRQYGKVRPAACVRDPDRLPAASWRAGDVIVLPNRIHLERALVQPGRLSLELSVAGDPVEIASIDVLP